MRTTQSGKQTDRQSRTGLTKSKMDLYILIAALGIGAFLALWWAMGLIPANTARFWALCTTLLLPVVCWGGFRYGQLEVKGRLEGIDQAVNSVMQAADKVADLRVKTARQMRVDYNMMNLPGMPVYDEMTEPWRQVDDATIVPRLTTPNDEVIDL